MKRLVLFMLLPYATLGQITMSFPQSRMVFQRNNDNYSYIQIAGNYTQSMNLVEARLVPLQGGGGTDWTTIQENFSNGFFRGLLVGYGGWYRLEVRGKLNGQIVATTSVDRVGVGEVFVVAGQSNAAGYDNFGNVGAADDRVNCISNYYSSGDNNDPPYPQISQLSAHVRIAPFGNGSWCWGKLGDLIAQRLNVPVLFMNAAWEGMGSGQWKLSSDGAAGYNFFSGNYAPFGFPYGNLKKSLQFYVSLLGIRSVLWHQGEADTDQNTSAQTYKNNLEYVISKTRLNTNKNLSWVVARVSKSTKGTSQAVIDGQNITIQETSNVFTGPNTDLIGERIDGIHFYGNGLITLASAWNNSLNDVFFANSTPSLPSAPLSMQAYCNSNALDNPVTLTMQSGFQSYNWSNGESNITTYVKSGSISGKAKDYFGNTYFMPTFNITGSAIPPKPTIVPNGSTTLCEGNTLVLNSNIDGGNFWSNGINSNAIFVNSSGDYSVTQMNVYGCQATSPSIKVVVNPSPVANIVADGPTTFCSNNSLKLSSTSTEGNRWSNGATSNSITVTQTGNYYLTVTNQFGCSQTSSVVNVKVNPQPVQPVIVASGATTFCADSSIFLSSPNSADGFLWSNNKTTQSISVNESGDYSLKIIDQNGCTSPASKVISVLTKAIPTIPTILQTGTYTLEASSYGYPTPAAYEWSLNNSKILSATSSIKVVNDGDYKVRGFIDYPLGNNTKLTCFSGVSSVYSMKINFENKGVSVYPNPSTLHYVNVETLEDLENAVVTLYSMGGAVIETMNVDKFDSKKTFDLANIPRGEYLLQIKNTKFNVTKRIILE